MGFDVSFHPLDTELIESRILPFIRGESSIVDLVTRGVEISRARFRANAWGLGLHMLVGQARDSPPGFFQRLRGRTIPDEVLEKFDSF